MKRCTKLFSIVLVLAMLFSMFPEMTFVMEKENVMAEVISGDAGDATWSFDAETGTLTYSGGTYVEYYGCEDYADEVKKIVFEEPVEEIWADYEGEEFTNLEEVVIPASVKYFDPDIISYSLKLATITVSEDNEIYYTKDGNLYEHISEEYEFDGEYEYIEYTNLCKYLPTKTDTSFIVPEDVDDIHFNAFTEGTMLEEIVLSEKMDYFILDCLAGLTSLKKVTFLNPEGSFMMWDDVGLDDVVICGYANTYIEAMAEEYGMTFEALPERKVKSMSIKSYPQKMTYEIGRNLVLDGLVLEVEYEDGDTAERTMGYEVTGFDSSQIGECEVTISMGGVSVTFTVEIVELDTTKFLSIGVDREVTVEISEDYEEYEDYTELYFTPEVSGEYAFYTKCNYDTWCELFDMNDKSLEYADDEDELNFYLTYELEAGQTYILRVGTYEESECTFKVKSKLVSSEEPHTEHNYISYVTEATDNSDGYTEYICDVCGDNYIEYTHNYETSVVPATCTAKGFTLHECKNCGDLYSDNEVPMLKHNYVETILKPATTTEQGEKQYKCSDCDNSYTESIAKLPVETTTVKEKPTEKTTVKKPGRVKKLKAKVSLKKVKLSWKKINKVSGYEVRIGTGKNVKKAVKKFVTKNKLTYKKIKKKTYYFKVRAYRKDNGKKIYGKWSKAKKFVVKK